MSTAQNRRSRDEMFVIRIWAESDKVVRNLWRASVTHVSSGQRHYFTNYGELCEFLDRWQNQPRSVRLPVGQTVIPG